MTIGERIKQARKSAGLTQKELAQMIGKGYSSLQKYELNIVEPSLEQLRKIALALGVTVSDLIDPEYWSTLPADQAATAFGNQQLTAKNALDAAFDQLNDEGQQKAVERVEELTEIPRYRKDNGISDAVPDRDKETPAGE